MLLTAGSTSGSDETYYFTERLYLDPESYLPIEMVSTGLFSFGFMLPRQSRQTFGHEFVPRDAVAPEFFEAASIGFVPADPELAFPGASSIPVYWLGRALSASTELPGLVLQQVHVFEGPGRRSRVGYRYILEYAAADDPFGAVATSLQIWPSREWDDQIGPHSPNRRRSQGWEGPCWTRTQIDFGDGRAEIFAGYDGMRVRKLRGEPLDDNGCPLRTPDTHMALAYFRDTTVMVIPIGSSSDRDGHRPSVYDTREGIEAVVRALHPRA